jgi:DinB superfamily
MSETAQQYISRIRSYMGDHDPLTVLAETPTRLQRLLYALPDARLRTRPEPKRWSIIEQVAHLADVEIAIGFRVRMILGGPDGIPIAAFDQDRWQQAMHYDDRDLATTLDAFAAARQNNLRLYRSLTEADWNKYGIHSERGRESVRDVVFLNAGHDLNHLRQIEAILSGSAALATKG